MTYLIDMDHAAEPAATKKTDVMAEAGRYDFYSTKWYNVLISTDKRVDPQLMAEKYIGNRTETIYVCDFLKNHLWSNCDSFDEFIHTCESQYNGFRKNLLVVVCPFSINTFSPTSLAKHIYKAFFPHLNKDSSEFYNVLILFKKRRGFRNDDYDLVEAMREEFNRLQDKAIQTERRKSEKKMEKEEKKMLKRTAKKSKKERKEPKEKAVEDTSSRKDN